MSKVVLYDSPEAASIKTVTGWVSRNGVFCGDDEHQARVLGATHYRCLCGEVSKLQTCDACHKHRLRERHKTRNRGPWDKERMIYSEELDDYYTNPKDALAALEGTDLAFENARFVLCDPQYLSPIDSFVWSDDLPDDGDLPPAVTEAVNKLNEVIEAQPPSMWYPSEIAWNGETKKC